MTTTAQRQDPHCPRNFRAEDYVFLGCLYVPGEDCDPGLQVAMAAERERVLRTVREMGCTRFDSPSCGCGICGTAIRYSAVLVHRPTNQWLEIGLDCADKFYLQVPMSARTAIKRKVATAREYAAGKAKARLLLVEDYGLSGADADTLMTLSDAYHDLTREERLALGWDQPEIGCRCDSCGAGASGSHDGHPCYACDTGTLRRCVVQVMAFEVRVLSDMISKLVKYGSWSPKQVQLAQKLFRGLEGLAAKAASRLDEIAGRESAQASERAAAEWLDADPGTRVRGLSGQITFARVINEDSQYGPTTLIKIKLDDRPVTLTWFASGIRAAEPGSRITFDCTVVEHEDHRRYGRSTRVNRLRAK